ncbi:MAG: molybdenum cofactor biosynthesis protein MoaE [Bacillota bacterium]|nr:molybdenum cofactor biosynthesis protein MoaE [Bacillota bacterium]
MRISVRLFAGAAEAVGARQIDLELAGGSTAGQLLDRLLGEHPALARFGPSLLVAVNRRYAGREAVLADGDEVALIPPVSGGSGDAGEAKQAAAAKRAAAEEAAAAPLCLEPVGEGGWFALGGGQLPVAECMARVQGAGMGAVVLFLGTVRRRGGDDREVVALEYEAYEPMAQQELRALVERTLRRWPATRVALAHRTGRLEVGEASVVIAVAAPHRAEAYEASRYLIEEIKSVVPIWKREIHPDGSGAWVHHA